MGYFALKIKKAARPVVPAPPPSARRPRAGARQGQALRARKVGESFPLTDRLRGAVVQGGILSPTHSHRGRYEIGGRVAKVIG